LVFHSHYGSILYYNSEVKRYIGRKELFFHTPLAYDAVKRDSMAIQHLSTVVMATSHCYGKRRNSTNHRIKTH